jgi:hypothetical protein
MTTMIRPVLRMIFFYKYPVADDDQLPEFVVLRDMDREAILRNRIILYLKMKLALVLFNKTLSPKCFTHGREYFYLLKSSPYEFRER